MGPRCKAPLNMPLPAILTDICHCCLGIDLVCIKRFNHKKITKKTWGTWLCVPRSTSQTEILQSTRLNPFAGSWFYNATAVRGALWWFRQSQRKLRRSSTFARRRHDVSNSCFPVLFGKSFMKIRSAVPENGCLIVLDGKNICKTYTLP